jgi:glycosyltransferase involved in cell wall biosynthesis
MRVALLADTGNADGTIGGAELTMREFAQAAPQGVHLTDKVKGADAVVVGNCTSFGPSLIPGLEGKRVVWYHNDLSPWVNAHVKSWLDRNATHVFCSPLHRGRYQFSAGRHGGLHLIPPAINLEPFRLNGNGNDREGAVSVGAWQNEGKGQASLWEWARDNEPVDVYGPGPFAPNQPPLTFKGTVEPDEVPEVLHRYRRFVHLPWAPEPFGRAVVEAWAAGCELIVNALVGARYWLTEDRDGLESAAEDFWDLVTA